MASVTGLTAQRMQEIEAACIVNGGVVLGDLMLTRQDGSTFNAGRVKGDKGDPGLDGLPGKDAAPGSVAPTPNTTPIRTANGRVKTAAPTENDDSVTKLYSDATHDFLRRNLRAQRLMSGGGIRRCSITGVGWSQRFMVMGLGRDAYTPSGYFNIDMPPDGTVIPVYADSTITSITVAGGEIPMTTWGALYFDIEYPAPILSKHNRFHLVRYTKDAPELVIPDTWVLIAAVNSDSRAARYMWGDGRAQDYWRTLALTSSWVAFGAPHAVPAWRFTNKGTLELKGLMKSGLSGSANPFTTIASDMAPGETHLFTQLAGSSIGATCRIDLLGAGAMFVSGYNTGASNAYVSLKGIEWFPADA